MLGTILFISSSAMATICNDIVDQYTNELYTDYANLVKKDVSSLGTNKYLGKVLSYVVTNAMKREYVKDLDFLSAGRTLRKHIEPTYFFTDEKIKDLSSRNAEGEVCGQALASYMADGHAITSPRDGLPDERAELLRSIRSLLLAGAIPTTQQGVRGAWFETSYKLLSNNVDNRIAGENGDPVSGRFYKEFNQLYCEDILPKIQNIRTSEVGTRNLMEVSLDLLDNECSLKTLKKLKLVFDTDEQKKKFSKQIEDVFYNTLLSNKNQPAIRWMMEELSPEFLVKKSNELFPMAMKDNNVEVVKKLLSIGANPFVDSNLFAAETKKETNNEAVKYFQSYLIDGVRDGAIKLTQEQWNFIVYNLRIKLPNATESMFSIFQEDRLEAIKRTYVCHDLPVKGMKEQGRKYDKGCYFELINPETGKVLSETRYLLILNKSNGTNESEIKFKGVTDKFGRSLFVHLPFSFDENEMLFVQIIGNGPKEESIRFISGNHPFFPGLEYIIKRCNKEDYHSFTDVKGNTVLVEYELDCKIKTLTNIYSEGRRVLKSPFDQ